MERRAREANQRHRGSTFEDHLHGVVDLEGEHEEDDARGRLISAQQQEFLHEVDRSRREQFVNRAPRLGANAAISHGCPMRVLVLP